MIGGGRLLVIPVLAILGCAATIRTGVAPVGTTPEVGLAQFRRIHLSKTCTGETGGCDRAVADALRSGLTRRGFEVSNGAQAMPEATELRIECECSVGMSDYLSRLFVVFLEAQGTVVVATGEYIPGWPRLRSDVGGPINGILDDLCR